MPCLPTVEGCAFDLSCLRLHRFSRGKTTKLLALLAAVIPIAAPAAVTNYIWDGNAPFGTGSSRWSRSLNWSATNTAPPANNVRGLTNSDITFRGVLKLAPSMDNAYFIRSLTFDPTAGAFTLSSRGSQVLTIGAGGILNQSASTQTILSSLSLSNAQTWNAAAGNLVMGGGVNLGANVLTVAGTANISLADLVQGSAQIIKLGSGNLTFGGITANTYSGGTTLDGGTITLAKANALGSGSLTVNSGTLDLGSFNKTVGVFSMTGGTVVGTTGTLTASGYQIQSGTIKARLGGNGLFVKSGPGTTTVSTANLFSGGTIINGGTLAINNLTGSGAGSGNVTINSGGTLIGTGIISGMVTNRLGGTISAGANIGQFNSGSQFWLGGSTNRWEINDANSTAGVGWDLLNISGTLNILATASNKLTFSVVSFTLGGAPGAAADFDPSQSYLWKVVQTSGGITFAPGEDADSAFNLMVGQFANPIDGGVFDLTTANGGRDLNLTYTPVMLVPEPHAFAFITLAACGYIYGRRFKRHWGSNGRRSVIVTPAQPSSTATAAA
ncbi:MAG: autotransporter-associated beta strand repeat-containing protein [Verrucomicrobiota bacterium]